MDAVHPGTSRNLDKSSPPQGANSDLREITGHDFGEANFETIRLPHEWDRNPKKMWALQAGET